MSYIQGEASSGSNRCPKRRGPVEEGTGASVVPEWRCAAAAATALRLETAGGNACGQGGRDLGFTLETRRAGEQTPVHYTTLGYPTERRIPETTPPPMNLIDARCRRGI